MEPSRHLRQFLGVLAEALATSRVGFTWKADDELAQLGWSRQDALHQLALLTPEDFLRADPARAPEWNLIWVFCPFAWDLDARLWIRIAEAPDRTLLVSFHVAEVDPWA